MNVLTTSVRSGAGLQQRQAARPAPHGRVHAVALPATELIADALPRVDWSDAYAAPLPAGHPGRAPLQWAEAIFHRPPLWVRGLFGVRAVVARMLGIEQAGAHVFALLSTTPSEVLLGTDQGHLSFRASVLLEPGHVVLSTIVQVHNRRGRGYSMLVRRIHPWVVRAMLARAARELGALA